MDKFTKEQRSYCMSQIKSRNTSVEVEFRKKIWQNGVRGYRLHCKQIPGSPDLFFPKRRLAVFIDGCFWHKCPKCYRESKSRKDYWDKKMLDNVSRDIRNNDQLNKMGIKVLRFWEHEIKRDFPTCFIKLNKIFYEK